MFKLSSATLCLSLFIIANAEKLVPFIDPCKWDDADCILKSSKKAISNMEDLIESGMVVKDVNGDKGDLKLKAKNMVVKNLSKCNIVEAKRPEKLKLSLVLDCPIDATGIYELGGKLLLLDVFGKGDFHIQTDQLRVEISINMAKETGKDGLEHYKFGKFDFKYTPVKKIKFELKNLFDGDEVRAEPINKLIDENWKELVGEFGAPIIKAVVVRAIKVIAEFCYKLPVDQFEIPS